jgi:prepilin-type N-terminal cleavage/methylation domain-containing protein
MKMRRRGLSLVEILIAIVLLGIVGAGITRMMQSQMRFFARSTNARDARAVSRNALNLVRNEMKMIEPFGIVAATADSIVVRMPIATGILCAGSTGTFAPIDSLTYATANWGGFAWRDTLATSNYTYVANTTAPTAGLAATCTGAGLEAVIPGGLVLVLPAAPGTAIVGAPLILFQTVKYKLAASTLVPGREALWRQVGSAAAEEVATPLDAASRIRFFEGGGVTAQDAVPATLSNITGIQLVLLGESERNSPGTAAPETNTQRVSIFFRNVAQ